MAAIPPWLNVQPNDFVQAAMGGARLAAMSERGQDVADARKQIVSAQLGAQEQRLQERLAEQERQKAAERSLREWEERAKLQLGQQQMEGLDKRAQDNLSQRRLYESALINERSRMSDIAKQRADQSGSKQTFSHMDPLDSANLHDAYIQRREAKAAASKALQSIASGGEVPAEIKNQMADADKTIAEISKRYSQAVTPPVNAAATSTATSPALPEGSRVRSRVTGKMGTVINGQVVPDQEPPAPSVFRGLPGAIPTSRGGMYMGEDLPVLTDRPAM